MMLGTIETFWETTPSKSWSSTTNNSKTFPKEKGQLANGWDTIGWKNGDERWVSAPVDASEIRRENQLIS